MLMKTTWGVENVSLQDSRSSQTLINLILDINKIHTTCWQKGIVNNGYFDDEFVIIL